MADQAARPPWSSEHVLPDGLHVLVRPLLPGDRAELAERYGQLSARSRHTRFFAPPDELSDDNLDYLTHLDYHDHYALAAFATDEPNQPGIAVARYVRTRDDPQCAEVAVTVLDAYQHRGLGTLLMRLLAHAAAEHDVRTFVYYVLWQNDDMIDLLRGEGARVVADEPGVARVELDLPESGAEVPEGVVRHLLHGFTAVFRDIFEQATSA